MAKIRKSGHFDGWKQAVFVAILAVSPLSTTNVLAREMI